MYVYCHPDYLWVWFLAKTRPPTYLSQEQRIILKEISRKEALMLSMLASFGYAHFIKYSTWFNNGYPILRGSHR